MNVLDFIRGAVRPVTTVLLAAAQIAFIGTGVASGNFDAAKLLAPFTMMALTFWYVGRENARRESPTP